MERDTDDIERFIADNGPVVGVAMKIVILSVQRGDLRLAEAMALFAGDAMRTPRETVTVDFDFADIERLAVIGSPLEVMTWARLFGAIVNEEREDLLQELPRLVRLRCAN